MANTSITPNPGSLSLGPTKLSWVWTQTSGDTVTDWRFEYGRVNGIYTQYTVVTDETLREITARTVINQGSGVWYLTILPVGASGLGTRSNQVTVDTGAPTVTVEIPFLPPTAGALALTGVAPTVLRGTVRGPTAGSVSLSGVVSTIYLPRVVTPSPGVVALSGAQPRVNRLQTITPTSGDLSLTGDTPSVTQQIFIARVITPDSGSLSLSGDNPTVNREQDRYWPSAGSLALTASRPTLFKEYFIYPDPGALTITSVPPPVVGMGPIIKPAPATLSLTGTLVTLEWGSGDWSITPNAGSLGITEGTPTVTHVGLQPYSALRVWDGSVWRYVGIVSSGDPHDHTNGYGAQIDHAQLANLTTGDPHTQYQQEIEKDAVSGYAGLNSVSRITKGVDTTDYIILDLSTTGLVLKDTQGTPHYWQLSVSNTGALTTSDLGTGKP